MVVSITLSRVYIFENHSPYKSLRFECRHACPTVTLENPKSEKVCEMTVTSVTLTVIAQPSSISAPLVADVAGKIINPLKKSFSENDHIYLQHLQH